MSDSVRPHRRQPTRPRRPWDSPGKNTGEGCHFLLQCMKVKSESKVTQSCLTLHNPMDCSPPGSSIHGIFQATVLEWGAIAFSEMYIWKWNRPKRAKKIMKKEEKKVGRLYTKFLKYTSLGELGWRRQWQPTPVLLPGKSHGRRSLVGCSPSGL